MMRQYKIKVNGKTKEPVNDKRFAELRAERLRENGDRVWVTDYKNTVVA